MAHHDLHQPHGPGTTRARTRVAARIDLSGAFLALLGALFLLLLLL